MTNERVSATVKDMFKTLSTNRDDRLVRQLEAEFGDFQKAHNRMLELEAELKRRGVKK